MDISVIIPSYKPGDYIWQCLDALKNQTLAKDRFEVVVVLNGCDEPYRSQIRDYIRSVNDNTHFRLVHVAEGGVSNARNVGLGHAQGRFIAFIDDDDWVSSSYLENLLQPADDGTIVVANVRNFNETTGQHQDDYLARAFAANEKKENISLLSGRSFFSCCPCKLIPRDVIGETRFDTRLSQSEDAVFMAALSKNVKTIKLATADTIYYRRTRKESARHRRSRLKAMTDVGKVGKVFAGLYLTDVWQYNLPFFLTRIAGLVKNAFRD